MRSSDPKAAEEMIRKVDDLPSPRTIKTHLPFELLPPNLLDTCKVIFVNRNIKDACVSMYYHMLRRQKDNFDSKFSDFAEEVFRAGLCPLGVVSGPSYFAMLKSQYLRMDHPNMLVLWYENMKKDQRKMVVDIKNHIKYDIYEEQIAALTEFMKFENYQKSSSMNKDRDTGKETEGIKFVRKGIVGDSKNHFDDDMARDWDEWIVEEFKKTEISDRAVLELIRT